MNWCVCWKSQMWIIAHLSFLQLIRDKMWILSGILWYFLSRKNILRCPRCKGYADKRDGYTICPKCGCKLITEDDYRSNSYHSDKPTVECPYCHSTDTKKILGLSKAGSVAFFVSADKPLHCVRAVDTNSSKKYQKVAKWNKVKTYYKMMKSMKNIAKKVLAYIKGYKIVCTYLLRIALEISLSWQNLLRLKKRKGVDSY